MALNPQAEQTKLCSKCGVERPLSQFRYLISKGYYKAECKLHVHLRNIFKLYGITQEEYEALLIKQNGLCAICGKKQADTRLGVDHNHKTNRVRGLLCYSCNSKLGWLEAYEEVIRIYRGIESSS